MASAASSSSRRDAGFSLVEVLFAVFMLSLVALGVAQLFAVGTRANWSAKNRTSSVLLATQKLEQLKALTWSFDSEGLPVSDTTTRLNTPQPTGGGTGLNPSPEHALTQDVDGFFDYINTYGQYVGTDRDVGNPAFCRRWSIQPLPTNPNNTLVFTVRVIPMRQRAGADATGRAALEEARMFSIKTRKAP